MEDGLTLEQHLVSLWKQTKVIPPQLDLPPIPFELQHIWDWWEDLDATRQRGLATNPITYTEIERWAFLLKINLDPFEVRCIMALDSAYMACHAEQQAKKAASAAGNK